MARAGLEPTHKSLEAPPTTWVPRHSIRFLREPRPMLDAKRTEMSGSATLNSLVVGRGPVPSSADAPKAQKDHGSKEHDAERQGHQIEVHPGKFSNSHPEGDNDNEHTQRPRRADGTVMPGKRELLRSCCKKSICPVDKHHAE